MKSLQLRLSTVNRASQPALLPLAPSGLHLISIYIVCFYYLNLLVIYELFTKVMGEEIEDHFLGKGHADFKRELAEVIIEGLRLLQGQYRSLAADPEYIATLLKEGINTIRPIAERILETVKNRVGLGYYEKAYTGN